MPHAMHWTSHIFLALGMWDEVVEANEAINRVNDSGRGQSLIGLSKCARLLKDKDLAESVDARLAKVGLREALEAKSN